MPVSGRESTASAPAPPVAVGGEFFRRCPVHLLPLADIPGSRPGRYGRLPLAAAVCPGPALHQVGEDGNVAHWEVVERETGEVVYVATAAGIISIGPLVECDEIPKPPEEPPDPPRPRGRRTYDTRSKDERRAVARQDRGGMRPFPLHIPWASVVRFL